MTAAKKPEKKAVISNAQKIGIGVGLTTAAVAAAGAYFLYGSKEAPKNRQKVRSWALKAKGEVLEVLEKADKITEDEFKALVDGVTATYGKAQKLSKKELGDFKKEMIENWSGLLKSGAAKVYQTAQVAEGVAKSVQKKAAAKKTVAKAPAKKAAVAKKAPAKAAPKKTA